MLEKQENLKKLAGQRVIEWTPGKSISAQKSSVYRIRELSYKDKESWEEKFARFLEDPAVHTVTGLVVGKW